MGMGMGMGEKEEEEEEKRRGSCTKFAMMQTNKLVLPPELSG